MSSLFGQAAFAHPGHEHDNTEWVDAGGAPPPGSGDIETTSFVRAVDGDTMETWISTSRVGIGIIGIDAPEANTICGLQASGYLQGLIFGGLHLEEDPELAFDDNDRRMYYVYTPTGESVAAMLAASGLVEVTGEGKEAGLLQELRDEAEAGGIGCFANPDGNLNDHGTLQENLDMFGASPLQSTILPPDLRQDTVVAGLNFPTSFSMMPDGRILIGEKNGIVRIFKDGQVLATPFIDIRSQVNDYWDRGLLTVAADPDFESNGYVYLLFTYENNPGNYSGPKTGRMIRVTATGDTASLSTAVTLLGTVTGATCPAYTADCIPSDAASHSTGGIAFGDDGSLYITLGEGAGFNVVDPDALRAQHPDSLGGKMLRVNSDGQGLPDNPFYTGNPNDNRSKIWASGLRNAYRLSINPFNGIPYVGDVGWNTWEEVSAAPAGANLGWPCYEGPARQGGYEPLAVCQTLYAQGSSAVQAPVVYWNHFGGGSAVTGGVFLDSGEYGSPYHNAYVYSDYVAGTISYIHVDENNNLTSDPTYLAQSADGPVDFAMGPDGYLYYLAVNTGEIRRIQPSSGGPDPGDSGYVSDMVWLSESNGWGPAERDMSNGEDGAGDGGPLSIRGTTFEKGIGVHARSEIVVDISDRCPVFTAVVGVDDEVAPEGSVTFQVWGDDMLMYESDVLTGDSAARDVDVDLSGHSTMRLVVTDGGDGIDYDHANWADARLSCGDDPPPTGDDLYLSDMVWLSETNAWGPAERDLSNGEEDAGDGGPLSIRGNIYEKGVGVHAHSEITVAVPALCPVFTTVVGIDDEAAPNGSVTFEILGDGDLIWDSGVLSGTSAPEEVTIDVDDYAELRLVVSDGGDNINWDHANWADARFVCDPPGSGVPTATITSPAPDYLFTVDDVIEFAGEAFDSDGNPIDPSGYSWRVIIHHCSAFDCHIHQLLNPTGVTSGTFVAPEHGIDPWYMEISLTVTQADGARTTTTMDVMPNTVRVTLDSSPPGLIVSFGAIEGEAPLYRDIAAGSEVTVQVPSPQGEYVFDSWSDGGAQQHNIVLGTSDITLTANFTEEDDDPPPAGEDLFISDMTWVSEENGWGPAERDTSNGEEFAGDGNPLTIAGQVYQKGLGVHAPSEIVVNVPELCPVFAAVVGIDDEVSPNGAVTFEVWGDDTRIYQSAEMTGAMAGVPISVDLTGHNTLRLVVDEGDTNRWDHANWADARFICTEDEPPPTSDEDTYVSDLAWESSTNGWGPAERDLSNGEDDTGDGAQLTMNGVVFEKGIGAHATSEIIVNIIGLCPYFHAVVGVDDEVGPEGSVRFEVYGDTTRLYQSEVLTGTSASEAVMVDLTGNTTLRLVMTDGGDGLDHDHGNWAIAMLSCDPTPPDGGTGPDPDPDPPAGLFDAPTSYDTGVNSHGVIGADVTGDGTLDLLVANAGSNSVSLFPGNGDGTFGAMSTLNVGGLAPKMVTTGDINNDGIPDLLTANQDSNGIGILLGTGGGSFAPAIQIPTCQRAHEVAVGDLDGDGNLDIATACWDDDHISVHLGNGDGTFAAPTAQMVWGISHSVQIADLNGDGILDLVADNYWGARVHIFLGNGDGTFEYGMTYAVGSGPHGVRVADLNGDGNLDIVTANDMAGTVSVLLGNGDGTFQPQQVHTVNPRPKSVAIGDVTGDGVLDIVVANTWGNYGASSFVPTDISVLAGTGGGSFAAAEHFPIDLTPFSVAIADFNGDGRNDVAVALWHSDSAAVFLNAGD